MGGPKQLKFQEKLHFSGKRNQEKGPLWSDEYGAPPLLVIFLLFSATLPQRQPQLCGDVRWQQRPGKGTLCSGGGGWGWPKREKKSLVLDMNQHKSGLTPGLGTCRQTQRSTAKAVKSESTLEPGLQQVRRYLHAV